jgi:GNAT superfamily N-acetyltransferase
MLPRMSEAAQALGLQSLSPIIRPLAATELPAAGKLLASVFDDDPWLRWVYRTAEQRRLLVELNLMSYLLMYSALESESFPNIIGAWICDNLVAVCFFVEPAARANEDRASFFFESIKCACATLPGIQGDAVYQRFLHVERDLFGGPVMTFRDDCYYLFMLGCHSEHRRHGLGALLVRRLTALAFSRGFGVYLDTFNDEIHDHRTYYSRFGFVPLSCRVLPGQDIFPDSECERDVGLPCSSVVDDTLVAWPTLQSRIQNRRVAAARPLPVAHTDSAAITSIGELRYSVWRGEGDFFPSSSSECWVDEYDTLPTCYHWVILGDQFALDASHIVACARLTFHAHADGHRDIKIFTDFGERNGIPLRFPVADLGRLVVASSFRCRGYAQQLNEVRIQAAKELGCASIVVTASASNAKMLRKLGFVQLMHHDEMPVSVVFDDRPSTVFYALYYAIT